jgi:uncharacterized protein
MKLPSTLVPLLLVALLGACASPNPPARLVQMRAPPPVAAPAAINAGVWQLMLPLRLPDYLDRDAILVPQGQAGLAPLPGQRWAEPLRDSVPRLLRADLATLLGEARVWSSPLPPGVVAPRQLRIEFLAFESNAEQSAVQLSARWSLSDATAATAAPRAGRVMFSVPVLAGSGVDGLVAAHRLALWQLAQALVEQATASAR